MKRERGTRMAGLSWNGSLGVSVGVPLPRRTARREELGFVAAGAGHHFRENHVALCQRSSYKRYLSVSKVSLRDSMEVAEKDMHGRGTEYTATLPDDVWETTQWAEPQEKIAEGYGEAWREEQETTAAEKAKKNALATLQYVWPRLLLLLVSAAYGTNFGTVKLLDESIRSSASAALRFSIAMLVLSPAMLKAPRGLLLEGLGIGCFVFSGYFFQSIALQTTEANKIAFLSALAVVFVPLLNRILPKQDGEERKSAPWLAVMLALSGVGLLELGGDTVPALGDFYGLIQGLFFSCGFVFNERATQKYPGNAFALSAAQLTTVGLLSLVWYFVDSTALYGSFDLQGIAVAASDPLVLGSLFYTGIVTTGIAVGLENVALNHVSASELSVLFSTEPFIAAAFSAFLLNESLSSQGVTGGILIAAACLTSQFWDKAVGLVKRVRANYF